MEPNKVTIYLIGQITSDPETYEWRRRIRKRFEEHEKFRFFDPCNNMFSKSVLKSSKGSVDSFKSLAAGNTFSSILVPRDMSYVLNSDVAIANLNLYTKEKPLLGTFFELAWYKMNPEKTVIGIFDGDPKENFICQHPFVRSAVHAWTRNEEQAGDILEEFFN
jgi:zona occludens toxin (predicted ATPase)